MAVEGTPKEFLMAEFVAIRAEVILTLGEVRALERYVVLACAALWSWAATHPDSPWILRWIPVVLSLLGGLRAWTYGRDLHFTHVYIGRLEKALLQANSAGNALTKDDPKGWETYDKEGKSYVITSAVVFWFLLLLASFIAIPAIPYGQKSQTSAVAMTCTPKPN
jgi:hypothetical protein